MKKTKNKLTQKDSIVKLVTVAMLSAVSFVLYLLEFPIFPAVGHLKMDLSDVPALFAGIAYGPVSAIVIELVKNIIELIVKGVGTQMGFGNLMNFIVGCAFVVPFSLLYRKLKEKGGNIAFYIPSAVGVVAIVAIGFCANYFVTPLFFKYFLGVDLDSATLWAAIGSATVLNAVKGVLLSVLSFPIVRLMLPRLKKFIR